MLLPVVQGGHDSADAGFNITISSDQTNYNLSSDLQNNYGWNGTDPINVTLTINSSINVYSTSTATPAITAHLVSGSTLTINNSGNVVGRGGAGGTAGSPNGVAGGAGGDAISLQNVTSTINNQSGAVIAGGGGGGGGGAGGTGGGTVDPETGCGGQVSFS